MKIILEGQLLSEDYMRGMNRYAKSLINTLIKRDNNEYALTVFDYNRERGNYKKLLSHLDKPDIPIHECNTLSYRDLQQKDNPFSNGVTYQSCTGAYGDVYHFLTQQVIPPNMGAGLVVTIHDLAPILAPQYYTHDEGSILRTKKGWSSICIQQPFIMVDSLATKRDVLNTDNSLSDKVFVVPLSYQDDILYPDIQSDVIKQLGITHPYILFFGAMEIRKGVDKLMQAFDILAEKHQDIDIVFAGAEFSNEVLVELTAGSRFKPRIKRLGIVDDKQRRTLYSGATAFVFPSLAEGFGLPVLEAMACGTPVITSNTSSLPEVAGDAAILIDPTDVEQLAYEMERVLTSESLRKELIAKGFENCKRFSWDKTAEMTEDVYRIAYESSQ